MHNRFHHVFVQGGRGVLPWALLAVVILSFGSGCGHDTEGAHVSADTATTAEPRSDDAIGPDAGPPAPQRGAEQPPAPSPPQAPLEFPDGPTVEQEYPELASAALVHARLVELPEGVLLQADGLVMTEDEIRGGITEAPAEVQEQFSKHAFFLLEQMATQELLVQTARRSLGDSAANERTLLQAYFQGLVETATVSDAEIETFHRENQDMLGGAPIEQVRDQIRQFLLQDKQQQVVDEHIRALGTTIPIAVSAEWVAEQAEHARDNHVDRARASGRPTLASFGADSCIPCQMMEPTRDAVREKYEGKANVEYVHVDEDQLLASRFGVQGIPLLIFFDADGKEFHRHTGIMSQEEIEALFEAMGVTL